MEISKFLTSGLYFCILASVLYGKSVANDLLSNWKRRGEEANVRWNHEKYFVPIEPADLIILEHVFFCLLDFLFLFDSGW